MFHVKHFGKVRPENLTSRTTALALKVVSPAQSIVRWQVKAPASLLTNGGLQTPPGSVAVAEEEA